MQLDARRRDAVELVEHAPDVVGAATRRAARAVLGVPPTSAAAARAPRSAKNSSSVSPPTRALSSSAVPCATTRPSVDHRDPVREPVGLLEVLGRQQDRRAVVGERL